MTTEQDTNPVGLTEGLQRLACGKQRVELSIEALRGVGSPGLLDLIHIESTASDLVRFEEESLPVEETEWSDEAIICSSKDIKTVQVSVSDQFSDQGDPGALERVRASGFRSLLGLRRKLTFEIVGGSGANGQKLGTLGLVEDIQRHIDGPPAVAILKSMTSVRVRGGSEPTWVALNPMDWETVCASSSAPLQLWGKPVFLSNAVEEGTAVTGDYLQQATLNVYRLSLQVRRQGDPYLPSRVQAVADAALVHHRPVAFAIVRFRS